MRKGAKFQRLLRKLWKQKWRCIWCDARISPYLEPTHPRRATIEHLVPVSRGGTNHSSNLAAACLTCNQARGNQTAPPGAVQTANRKRAEAAAAIFKAALK